MLGWVQGEGEPSQQKSKADRRVLQEAENHSIDLPDDPTYVETMLKYLYGLDYTMEPRSDYVHSFGKHPGPAVDDPQLGFLSSLQLITNACMYELGAKYGIEGLKGVACEKFAETLKHPEWHGEWVFSDIGTVALIEAIECLYTSTPEPDKGLRDQIIQYVKLHLERLLPMENFKAVLAKVPELSYQLLVQEVEDRLSESRSLAEASAKKRKIVSFHRRSMRSARS